MSPITKDIDYAEVLVEIIHHKVAYGNQKDIIPMFEIINRNPERIRIGRSILQAAIKKYNHLHAEAGNTSQFKTFNFGELQSWRNTVEAIRESWSADLGAKASPKE